MLVQLDLRNIVLISRAVLQFGEGLTVLSGETGAGKSILLDALGLVLGKRAESRLVRSGEEQARATAVFDISSNTILKTWLNEQGIDPEDTLILKRQISRDGASRAFVNDQPVTLKMLKSLGEKLVEIHGQHGQKGLLDAGNHRVFLDAYAGNEALLTHTKTAYQAWYAIVKEIATLEAKLEQAERERDYLRHVLDELNALTPELSEEEALVEKRTALMQAEKSGAVLQQISTMLNADPPAAESLRRAQTALLRSPIAETPQAQAIIDSLERALYEVAEAEIGLEALLRADNYDERALDTVEERLFSLREAARKHRTSPDGLVDIWQHAKHTIHTLDSSDERLKELNKQRVQAANIYNEAAKSLHDARVEAGEKLANAIHAELAPLKMEATRFRVICEPRDESGWSVHGADTVYFEVSTNPGSPFGALNAIASGGELSRFMLALAVVLGGGEDAPMLIFDEIDAGTGGAVADAIGARLKQLSTQTQVCVVTHAPQVAARADTHYYIQKSVRDGATHTELFLLDGTARHEEMARMLSGAEITQEARMAAAKLLERS